MQLNVIIDEKSITIDGESGFKITGGSGGCMKTKLSFTKNFLLVFVRILARTTPVWGVMLLVILGLVWFFARTEGILFVDALYFGTITALTIGYGDITPLTNMGKVIAVTMGLMGVLNTGIIVAIALQAMRVTYDAEIEQAMVHLEQSRKV